MFIKKYSFFLLFIAFLAILLFLRYETVKERHKMPVGFLTFEGVLKETPSVFGRSQYFSLGSIRIRTQKFPEMKFGDRLRVSGELGERGLMYFPQVAKIGESNSFFIKILSPIVHLREKIRSNMESLYGEPHASLIIGMLIGVDNLSRNIKNDLISTGTIHVVVVSGFNVSLIIGVVFNLFRDQKRMLAIIVSGMITIFYVILAGANPPVVRAAIMGTLGFIGSIYGRKRDGFTLLLIAAYVLLFIDPIIISSISFQFSFLATLGLILLFDDIRAWINNILLRSDKDERQINGKSSDLHIFLNYFITGFIRDLSSTLAASVMVYPLISFYFGRISIISPLINAITLWSIPLITFMSIVVGFLSLLSIKIVNLITWIVYLPLSYFVYIVQLFGNLKISSINFKFGISDVIFIYLLIFTIILYKKLLKS